MRNLKKFLALVLAMLMIVSASAVVSASDFTDVADDSIYAEAIADLVEKGITNGVAAGQFGPDQPVQRFQMALFMARALEPDVDDWMTGMQVFDDVNEWYGAIAYAYVNNIVTGMGNNLFAPHDGIRYQDALIMALRALGYKVDVSGDPYWLAAYNQAQALGLTKGVEVYVGEQVLTRAETAQIIYNMLKTTPADGGLTLNEKNFGEDTPANTTTFIITATPKQYYAESYDDVTEGYVGLQEIVNGLPTGDILYREAKDLGIDADEIENYFGYAVGLINYDKETGIFDGVKLGADPVVVSSVDVEYTSNNSKLKIDGITYTPVDEFDGTAIYNEIIVLNSGDLATSSKKLATDKDGNVVNEAGDIVAEYRLVGDTVCYYDIEAKDIITKAQAEVKYGVYVPGASYDNYSTLTADAVKSTANYQLYLFDDDGDDKFERAIVAPVYVSVYKAVDGDGKETFGPMKGEKVTYTDDAAKVAGAVFTYTYNEQTKVVNVIDVLETTTGIVTKVNTTDEAKGIVKVTVGGEVYTLGSADEAGKIGATLTAGGKFNLGNGNGDKELNFVKWSDIGLGNTIEFYSLNDYIIYAEKVFDTTKAKILVYDTTVNYDDKYVYADIYFDGKLEKNAKISKYNGKEIADLNIVQLTLVMSEIFNLDNEVLAAYKVDGKYEISTVKAADYDDVLGLKSTFNSNVKVYFDDGIADQRYEGTTLKPIGATENVLRADKDTIFYFIDENDAYAYVGAPDKSSIDMSKVTIYTDKIGFTGTNAGVADYILVVCDEKVDIEDAIVGFGYTAEVSTVVYVATASVAEIADADEIGITGDGYYYCYSVKGVNMQDGAKIEKIYSKNTIEAGKFYQITKENVVSATVEADSSATKLGKADFQQFRYYQPITGVIDANTVSTVGLVLSTGNEVKFDSDAKALLGDNTYTIKFIKEFNTDGSFIGIIMTKNEVETAKDITNASYTENGKIYGAISSIDENKKVTVQLYKQEIEKIGDKVEANKKSTSSQSADANIKVFMSTFNKQTLKFGDFVEVSADVEYKNGVLTVSNVKDVTGMVDVSLNSDTIYQFRVGINYGDRNTRIAIDYYVNN